MIQPIETLQTLIIHFSSSPRRVLDPNQAIQQPTTRRFLVLMYSDLIGQPACQICIYCTRPGTRLHFSVYSDHYDTVETLWYDELKYVPINEASHLQYGNERFFDPSGPSLHL